MGDWLTVGLMGVRLIFVGPICVVVSGRAAVRKQLPFLFGVCRV